MRQLLAAMALFFCLTPVSLAQTYEEGLQAFEMGDMLKAQEIWGELARQGDGHSEYGLGKLYETGGAGVPADSGRAAGFYNKAAEKGIPAAKNNLALMYSQGRGVKRDRERAIKLWREAADQGHLHAQYNLGLAYYRGEGVPQDAAMAGAWFRRAADGGLAEAQFAVGEMHRLGVGLTKDEGVALTWFRRAGEQGYQPAGQQANRLIENGIVPKNPNSVAGPIEIPDAPRNARVAPAESLQQAAATPSPSDLEVSEAPTPIKQPVKQEPEKVATQTAAAPPAAVPPAASPPAVSPPTPWKAPAASKAPAAGKSPDKPAGTGQVAATPVSPNPVATKQVSGSPVSGSPSSGSPVSGAQVALAAKGGQAKAPAASSPGGYAIWIGSMKSEAGATRLWQEELGKHPDLLKALDFETRRIDVDGRGTFYRVLAASFPSQLEAERGCERLKQTAPEGFCQVVRR